MTPFKIDIAIMCEYLTESKGNKHTLVNVIPGNLVVNEFPAQLPVAFYFEVTPKITETADYQVEIKFGKKRAAVAEAHIEFVGGKQGVIALPVGLLKAESPGEIRVTISRDGGRPVTLLKKQILAGEAAT